MPKIVITCLGAALLAVNCLPAANRQAATPSPPSSSQQHAFLNRYCVTCHNEKLKTANLMLDRLDVADPVAAAPAWEKVTRKLRARAMPPAGMPRPDNTAYDSFANYLETSLDRASAANPNPGRPAIHRLNRAEYSNAIRDLLAIDSNAVELQSLLPVDDSGYGFDNIADVLTMSPLLMEGYLSAARKISRLAIGDSSTGPVVKTYEIPRYVLQDDRMSEDLPFGSRGGAAIRHYFPADGEYAIKIRLQTNVDSTYDSIILGLNDPHQLDLRLDGERLKLFAVGGEAAKKKLQEIGKKAAELTQAEKYEMDSGLEVRLPVSGGTHLIQASFVESPLDAAGPYQPPVKDYGYANQYGYPDTDPAVGSVIISGPYNAKSSGETASRRKLFACHPADSKDEEPCARKILASLARYAFRRPVTDRDIQSLLTVYRTGRDKGTFDDGIRVTLDRILVDPEFLFRIEQDPANVNASPAYRISDVELASRLSFFLWSSLPDDQLLAAAERGKLKDPAVLEQQVRRMLADPRSKSLVDNFAGQWLFLRNVSAITPNPDVFPEFEMNLRDGFLRETELFFEGMLKEDRSVLDLLRADYTYVNERLARHYGIPNVYGSRFRRVKVTDENRKGLLGQASILSVTSYATRTSPVLRGKWILENILGAPPPPPPPNVPSLVETNKDGKVLSVRQQMEQHRANPVCASCHSRMDPLGFALENFDGTGRWRDKDGNAAIDSSGVLPDGTKFSGPAELRRILLSQPEQFVTTVTEKLLTYALGRGVEYYDQPAIRKIMRDAAAGDYRWSSLVLGIVKSVPFQMRSIAPGGESVRAENTRSPQP